MQIDTKKLLSYLLPLLVIIIVNLIYFLPQFNGKVIKQGDQVQWKGMANESLEYEKKSGEKTLWTNSMFGGMPTYQINTMVDNNLVYPIRKGLSLFFDRPAGYFIAAMLCGYILFLVLGISPWLSLAGAFVLGFNTSYLILFEAGHNNKLMALAMSPLVIAGVLLVLRNKYWLGGSLFGVGLALNIASNHPQMTYYLAISLGILMLFELAKSIKTGKVFQFIKQSLYMLILAGLAIGASATQLITTYEYTKSTMRGGQVLESDNDSTKVSNPQGGLNWDYAMQWSHSVGDLVATIIPKAVGGASGELVDKNSKIAKELGQRRDIQLPLYHGGMPFTSGPAYFSIVMFLLFVFGVLSLKNPLKWAFLAIYVLTMLLSMGKYFEPLNRLVFDYLPLYNKFRAHSSIVNVTILFIPILGLLAIKELAENTNRLTYLRPLYWAVGTIGGFCLLTSLLGATFMDFSSPGDQQYENIKTALENYRQTMLTNSSLRSLLFTLLTGGILYAFIKEKITTNMLYIGIIVITLIDLVPNGRDYLGNQNFVSKSSINKEFEPRPVDLQILKDTDPHYRVLDVTINTFNSASSSYFHKTIGGYHAAKLQRYQDLIDKHISQNNLQVLNMLNTKYFIYNGQDGQPTYQFNTAALGNAWFINNIKTVGSNQEELDSLSFIDPSGDVIIHKEFESYLGDIRPEKNGNIRLTNYSPNKLEYTYETETKQFAVFSEVWYGPNLGWQAYIDDQPAEHIRVNYVLRGMILPSGKHNVRFEFNPPSFALGKRVSLISSSAILALCLLSLIIVYKDKSQKSKI